MACVAASAQISVQLPTVVHSSQVLVDRRTACAWQVHMCCRAAACNAAARLQVTSQLAVVRESHARTSIEVLEAQQQVGGLTLRVTELESEVDRSRQGFALRDAEMEVGPACPVIA